MINDIIQVEGLCKEMKGKEIVKNVSFSVKEGSITGLLGPNGSGKTTIIRLLSGVIEPSSGDIRVMGHNPLTNGEEIRKNSGIVNAITYPVYSKLIMFNEMWFVMMFWVTPALILLVILFNVLVSARSKTLQEAQQLGGIIILPAVGFVISQTAGLFLLTVWICFLIGLLLFGIVALLLVLTAKYNNRNVLFESQIR